MGTFSIGHWVVVLLVVMVLFGRGKISEMMGDLAKGIKSFKNGMAEDEQERARVIPHVVTTSDAVSVETRKEASVG